MPFFIKGHMSILYNLTLITNFSLTGNMTSLWSRDPVPTSELQQRFPRGLRLSQSRTLLQQLDTQQQFGSNGSQLIAEKEKDQINMSSQMWKMIPKDILRVITICRLFLEKENVTSFWKYISLRLRINIKHRSFTPKKFFKPKKIELARTQFFGL